MRNHSEVGGQTLHLAVGVLEVLHLLALDLFQDPIVQFRLVFLRDVLSALQDMDGIFSAVREPVQFLQEAQTFHNPTEGHHLLVEVRQRLERDVEIISVRVGPAEVRHSDDSGLVMGNSEALVLEIPSVNGDVVNFLVVAAGLLHFVRQIR